MAGGIGSRFWPMSRTAFPKQFHDILGTGRTLIQMTYDRFLPIVPKENILVVTNERYKALVLEQLPDLKPEQVLCEPFMRNTAPCVAYSAFWIAERTPDANIVVAPSDHLITREASFTTDLGADSLDQVELVMELEEEFGVTIPDEAAEKITTVGQAIDYIVEHQSA